MVGQKLRTALDQARADLEAGLADAEAELAVLDGRRAELLALIAQARAALGLGPASVSSDHPSGRSLTLHEAIAMVLREHGNEWMTARELATEINGRALYQKRDGSAVETNQIHARTKNYSNLFEKTGSKIRLRPI
jgi:hypothetical protein